jgi:hypothetical protein
VAEERALGQARTCGDLGHGGLVVTTLRVVLCWDPSGPGLIADLEQGHYFACVPA